jgi:hypothetical protein
LPRRATFFQQVRGYSPTLAIDGGDVLFGSPGSKAPSRGEELAAMRVAKSIVAAYDLLGYQAVGIGPADLQYGVERLVELYRGARFRVVSANLVEKKSGKPVFEPWTIVEVNGVRFGIYSVMLRDLNAAYRGRVLGETYDLLDPIATTRSVVAELKKQVDIVIGLSQLNVPENDQLAAGTQGLDLIVDPYARFGTKAIWVTEGEYVLSNHPTPIVRIDGQGSRVGLFEMTIDTEADRITGYQMIEYGLEPQIFPHPDMVETLAAMKRTPPPKPETLPRSLRVFTDSFYGRETCGGCHQAQLDFWGSTRHAKAFDTLLPAAGAPADADRNAECVECHTTGYGVFFVDLEKSKDFRDVQCESCHGYRESHPDAPRLHRFGPVSESPCWGCHNAEITERPFDYNAALPRVSCPKMTEN